MSHPLPKIGLGTASHGEPLGPQEIERLKALELAHLRVDLNLSRPEYPARLRQARLMRATWRCLWKWPCLFPMLPPANWPP